MVRWWCLILCSYLFYLIPPVLLNHNYILNTRFFSFKDIEITIQSNPAKCKINVFLKNIINTCWIWVTSRFFCVLGQFVDLACFSFVLYIKLPRNALFPLKCRFVNRLSMMKLSLQWMFTMCRESKLDVVTTWKLN